MAATILRLMLQTFFILFIAIFHYNRPVAAAHISVKPLWDFDSNDTQPCLFKEGNSSEKAVSLYGSAEKTCSIQVNVTLGSYARIELPVEYITDKSFSLYIEKLGNLVECTNKFVAFSPNTKLCSSILLYGSLILNLQGNIGILVTGVSALESPPMCPESNDDILPSTVVNPTPDCKGSVKGYTNQMTCEVYFDGECYMLFPTNCNATLGDREVALQCNDSGVIEAVKSLIVYPIGISDKLFLAYNNIMKLEVNSFQSLIDLGKLYLHENYLTRLNTGVFSGLYMLRSLYLEENQIAYIEEDVFQGLVMLSRLELIHNKLITLPEGLFHSLRNLDRLYLGNNKIVTLIERICYGLSRLTRLELQYNKLVSLPGGLFRGLESLEILHLESNQLVTIDGSIFLGLRWLNRLDLQNNDLMTLPEGLFHESEYLEKLFLRNNQLVSLNANMLYGLRWLTILELQYNNLNTLPGGMFQELNILQELALTSNKLVTFNEDNFQGLIKLRTLYLNRNKLISLPVGLFGGLSSLYELYLDENKLSTLESHLFNNLTNLRILTVFQNRLKEIPEDSFNRLSNLQYLILYDNQLEWLGGHIFKGLFDLQILYLHTNNLRKLDVNIFKDLLNINYLILSDNKLTQCPDIKHLDRLRFFNVRNNPLTAITRDTFSNLSGNVEMAVSQHEICQCYTPADANCDAADKRSPYLTCDRLLSDPVLVILMWLIGINAFGGNIFVLVWRKKNTNKYEVQDILLSNLAMSDSLMGFYMVIVASADIYYGEYFPMQSESWRSGVTCRVSGSISIASTQLSIFFLTLISFDRFIGIKFPYSSTKLGTRSTIGIAVIIWICSLSLGIVPSILSGRNFKFYDNSHVCIDLPLALTKTYSTDKITSRIYPPRANLYINRTTYTTEFTGLMNGLYYSSTLFLGLNGLCYLMILACYIEIFRAVTKSAKQSGRTPDMDEQLRLIRNVTAIVVTDFMCISPIIVLGILVQTRVIELPPSVYAWSVTVVLPINSAINPYLYTIAEIISKSRKKKADKKIKQDGGSTVIETVTSRENCTTNVP